MTLERVKALKTRIQNLGQELSIITREVSWSLLDSILVDEMEELTNEVKKLGIRLEDSWCDTNADQ